MLDFQNFLDTLPIMGKGMAGIFVVTLVIVFLMWLMNKLTNRKTNESDDKKDT